MPPPPLRVDTQAKAGSSKQVAAPAAAAFSSPSQSSSSHPSHAGPSSSSPRSSLSPVTPVKRQRQFSSSASMSTSPPTTDTSLTTAATSTSAHASMHAHNKVRGHDVPPPRLDTFTWRASDGEAAGETFRTLAPAMRPYPMGSADALSKTVDTQALWQQQLMEQICFAWMFIRLVRARLGWEHEGKRGEKRRNEESERKVKIAREGRGKEPQGLKKGFLVNKSGVKTKAK
ncbi:hypothetical protein BDZ90DRAFT_231880 [Jaminaea rosea]|uniref:Uncharacterized protein n=1 Tax=Jaminaea rosea TaxID=1569628 RepID=A0A316UT01_9BASI|nr:hypothetical protein BDZ90DRAFT_231880 [Jaminaea rosea]PWN28124.1 hypothetical protein BDZ90DRAFT_231880 [Jaminaea rosea]